MLQLISSIIAPNVVEYIFIPLLHMFNIIFGVKQTSVHSCEGGILY